MVFTTITLIMGSLLKLSRRFDLCGRVQAFLSHYLFRADEAQSAATMLVPRLENVSKWSNRRRAKEGFQLARQDEQVDDDEECKDPRDPPGGENSVTVDDNDCGIELLRNMVPKDSNENAVRNSRPDLIPTATRSHMGCTSVAEAETETAGTLSAAAAAAAAAATAAATTTAAAAAATVDGDGHGEDLLAALREAAVDVKPMQSESSHSLQQQDVAEESSPSISPSILSAHTDDEDAEERDAMLPGHG